MKIVITMKMTDDDDCDRVEGDQDAKGAEDENKCVRDHVLKIMIKVYKIKIRNVLKIMIKV